MKGAQNVYDFAQFFISEKKMPQMSLTLFHFFCLYINRDHTLHDFIKSIVVN
jgi:hypothetical protein